MTRDRLEARIWRLAPGLAGPDASRAMDAILRAADAYARSEAGRMLFERDRRTAAALWPPDDPGLTAQRRQVLEDALPPDPRVARRRSAA